MELWCDRHPDEKPAAAAAEIRERPGHLPRRTRLNTFQTHSIDRGPQSAPRHKGSRGFDLRSTGGRERSVREDEGTGREGGNQSSGGLEEERREEGGF